MGIDRRDAVQRRILAFFERLGPGATGRPFRFAPTRAPRVGEGLVVLLRAPLNPPATAVPEPGGEEG